MDDIEYPIKGPSPWATLKEDTKYFWRRV